MNPPAKTETEKAATGPAITKPVTPAATGPAITKPAVPPAVAVTPSAAKAPAPKAKAAPAKGAGTNVMALTKAMIFKQTGHKPLALQNSTMPHVSTGSVIVDYLIGGSPAKDGKGPVCPGFPRRKITEVYGAESSGKTTLTLATIADVQRRGGTCMFLDYEHALHHGYAQSIGVKFDDSLSLYAPDTMEEGFKMMLIGVMTGIDLIVVDSIAAMVPEAELEKEPGEAAKVGGLAKPLAELLPKFALWLSKYPMDKETKKPIPGKPGTALVFINQTRATINTGGGGGGPPQDNTSGGKALKFFAYVRLALTRVGSQYIERKDPLTGKMKRFPYGNQTKVKCVKSKCDSKQGHEVEIFIRYGFGIDNYYSVIETAAAQGISKKDGTWITYGGERWQGRDKFRQYLIENPSVFDELCRKVNTAVLSTAEQAIEDDEMTEEERLMAEVAKELDGEAELSGGVVETLVTEG